MYHVAAVVLASITDSIVAIAMATTVNPWSDSEPHDTHVDEPPGMTGSPPPSSDADREEIPAIDGILVYTVDRRRGGGVGTGSKAYRSAAAVPGVVLALAPSPFSRRSLVMQDPWLASLNNR